MYIGQLFNGRSLFFLLSLHAMERKHDSFVSQVIRRKFGNTKLRKNVTLYYYIIHFEEVVLVLCGKNHWQLEHIKKDIDRAITNQLGKKLV